MDINYHYFAVKTIAVEAGFSPEDSQLVASYSQFVDDFTNYKYMIIKDVPPFAQHLATKIPFSDYWLFNPVTTGFESFFDMALLSLEKNQRNILAPFHFIPPNSKLNTAISHRSEWRVIPTRLDLPSLMRELLFNARDLYLNDNSKVNLMRIGVLLHIFADTYSHQNFSGWWNWENHSKLLTVTDNITGEDITSKYNPDFYYQIASIGHTNVNTAPDDSNVSFEMEQKLNEKDSYSIKLNRSNTSEFLKASNEILNYLLSCKGKKSIEIQDWFAFSDKLRNGLLTSYKEPFALSRYWHNLFQNIDYKYDKNQHMQLLLEVNDSNFDSQYLLNNIDLLKDKTIEVENFSYSSKSDDFFHYNVIADDVRKFVNGGEIENTEWDTIKLQLQKLEKQKD